MVIECPACKTKFKLPDEKVGSAGVSVRCSKCATTFAVRPPAAAAEKTVVSVPTVPEQTRVTAPPPAPPSQPPQPAPMPMPDPFAVPPPAPNPFGANAASGFAAPPSTPPPSTPPPDPFGANAASGFAFPPPTPPPSPSAPPAGFGGLSAAFSAGMAATAGDAPVPPPMPPPAGFGTPFVGLEMPGAAPPAPADDPSTLANEGESTDAQPGIDTGLRAALLGANAPGSSLSEEEDAGMTRDPAAGPASFDFGEDPFAAGAAPRGPQPAPPPSELFGARPTPPPQSIPAPAPSIGLAGPEKQAAAPKKAALKKPVQRLATASVVRPIEPSRAYRILLALFFAGAFASAFASLTDGTFDPNRLDRGRLSLLIGPPGVAEGIQGLAITARRGGYVSTAAGKPRVYTAHGVAINESAAPKGYLEVRGRILDAKGGVLAETTAPCGNAFRDDQLLGFRSSDELRRAYLPAGDGLSNANVAPGSAVACTVVFFEAPAPEETAAFELEIVSAQPAS